MKLELSLSLLSTSVVTARSSSSGASATRRVSARADFIPASHHHCLEEITKTHIRPNTLDYQIMSVICELESYPFDPKDPLQRELKEAVQMAKQDYLAGKLVFFRLGETDPNIHEPSFQKKQEAMLDTTLYPRTVKETSAIFDPKLKRSFKVASAFRIIFLRPDIAAVLSTTDGHEKFRAPLWHEFIHYRRFLRGEFGPDTFTEESHAHYLAYYAVRHFNMTNNCPLNLRSQWISKGENSLEWVSFALKTMGNVEGYFDFNTFKWTETLDLNLLLQKIEQVYEELLAASDCAAKARVYVRTKVLGREIQAHLQQIPPEKSIWVQQRFRMLAEATTRAMTSTFSVEDHRQNELLASECP